MQKQSSKIQGKTSWQQHSFCFDVFHHICKASLCFLAVKCPQRGFVSWFLFEFSPAQEPQKNWDSCTALYLLHGVGRNCNWRIDAKLNRKCCIETCLRPLALEKNTFSLSSNCHIERKSLVFERGCFYSVKKHLLKNAAQALAISPLSGCAFSSHCCCTQE